LLVSCGDDGAAAAGCGSRLAVGVAERTACDGGATGGVATSAAGDCSREAVTHKHKERGW
jgi:hypothetical protein